jgi:hypothetical protein
MNFEIGDLSKAGIYAFLITSSFFKRRWFYWLVKKTDKLKLMVLINKLEKNKYTRKVTEYIRV